MIDANAALRRAAPKSWPTLHPTPEHTVSGRRAVWYDEMKATLRAPWMGVVTMALSHYPTFFEAYWRAVRPLAESAPFVDASVEIRAAAEAAATALEPRPIAPRLRAYGYAPAEIVEIRATIDVFHRGNPAYLLLATVARLGLEGGAMGGSRDPAAAPATGGAAAPGGGPRLVLMEPHHATGPVQDSYADLQRVLGLPFVNTDYRALARWPSYWLAAWGDLRAVAATPPHEAAAAALHARAVAAAAETLPNPGGLEAETLRAAAAADAPAGEVLAVARLFHWLLPGLIVNVAYLRAQLLD